jgi:DNA polymerase-3 subunit beta
MNVNRKLLVAALKKQAFIVQKWNTIPILGFVHCSFLGGKLLITGTDLDNELQLTIEADGSGEFMLPLHTALRILSKMQGDDVTFEHVDGLKYKATCGRSSFTFLTLQVCNFPDMSFAGDVSEVAFPEGVLHAALKNVRHAISSEETRFYLNGAYLDFTAADPVAVATDGHRLALHPMSFDFRSGQPTGEIVPTRAVDAVLKCLAAGEVSIELVTAKARFTSGDDVLTSKLIDGKFPDYTRVIPKASPTHITVNADDLASAVKVVLGLSYRSAITFEFDQASMVANLSSNSPDGLNATASLDIKAYTGDAFASPQIGFNGKYVLDMCARYKGRDLTLEIATNTDPVVIRTDLGAIAGLSVLMPVMV